MNITALDIKKQEFARSFRGYDPDEVDSFLQVIAMQWQELVDDLRRSQERLDEQQLKLDHYMKVEEALGDALQTARTSARETVENAERKAAAILEEAEDKIVRLQKEADMSRLDMKRETARYAVRQQEIVAKLRSFLVSEMEMLRHFEAGSAEHVLPESLEGRETGGKEIEMYRDDPTDRIRDPKAEEAYASEADDLGEDDESIEAAASPDSETSAGSQETTVREPDAAMEDQGPSPESESAPGGLSEDVGEPDWRVNTVIDSSEIPADSGAAPDSFNSTSPEEDGDDEIRKIHEILKGLDEEQDANDDAGARL